MVTLPHALDDQGQSLVSCSRTDGGPLTWCSHLTRFVEGTTCDGPAYVTVTRAWQVVPAFQHSVVYEKRNRKIRKGGYVTCHPEVFRQIEANEEVGERRSPSALLHAVEPGPLQSACPGSLVTGLGLGDAATHSHSRGHDTPLRLHAM